MGTWILRVMQFVGFGKKKIEKKSVSFYGKIGRHLGERTVEVGSLVGFYLVESFGHF